MKSAIPANVLEVLRRSTVTADRVILPAEQLDRKTYEAVNKVLADVGGKWNRSARAHLFTKDPRPALGLAVETGVSVNAKKARQAFYTPDAVADQVIGHADIEAGMTVLEPSAGNGSLIRAIDRLASDCRCGRPYITAIELDADEAEGLKGLPGIFTVHVGDFMKQDPKPAFDRIVMNPPFTKKQDIRHVIHAYQFLKPGGRLVAITSPTADRDPKFVALLRSAEFHDKQELPEGAFKESGTNIRTAIHVIDKP